MTRRQRGIVSGIDFYEHPKFKVRVPISLNKETGQFFAEYGQESFYCNTLAEIKEQIYKHIQATTGLDWIPVIQVMIAGGARTFTDVLNDDMHGDEVYQKKFEEIDGKLAIHAKRYWIAQRPDGHWMSCEIWDSRDWDAEGVEPENHFLCTSDRRINARDFYDANHNKDFVLPFTKAKSHFEQGDTYYLPYDESLWQALNAIGDKMRELLEQLVRLVGTVNGRKKLAAFAQRMLPPGETK
jgi:hypothetical protein